MCIDSCDSVRLHVKEFENEKTNIYHHIRKDHIIQAH